MSASNKNNIKSNIGKTVNLHLKDGSTILNVTVIRTVDKRLIYKPQKNGKKPKLQSINIDELRYFQQIDPRLQKQ